MNRTIAYATTFESLPGTAATLTIVREGIHPTEGLIEQDILDSTSGMEVDDLLTPQGEFDENEADGWIADRWTGEKGATWSRVGPWRRKGPHYYCEVE